MGIQVIRRTSKFSGDRRQCGHSLMTTDTFESFPEIDEDEISVESESPSELSEGWEVWVEGRRSSVNQGKSSPETEENASLDKGSRAPVEEKVSPKDDEIHNLPPMVSESTSSDSYYESNESEASLAPPPVALAPPKRVLLDTIPSGNQVSVNTKKRKKMGRKQKGKRGKKTRKPKLKNGKSVKNVKRRRVKIRTRK